LECLTAADFLSVEVCTIRGLVTYYILFFVDIASRSVHIAGITPHPVNSWMTQVARNTGTRTLEESSPAKRGMRLVGTLPIDATYRSRRNDSLEAPALPHYRIPRSK
jgi:putative transposase